MTALASLTATSGSVNDTHTDLLGVVHKLVKVDADGVYTWVKKPQAAYSEDGASWLQSGDKLIQYGSFLSVGDPGQLVTFPRPFADTNYSVVVTPIDTITQGLSDFGVPGVVQLKTTTTFSFDRDNEIQDTHNTSLAWVAMGVLG